jgi:hypothetical protein
MRRKANKSKKQRPYERKDPKPNLDSSDLLLERAHGAVHFRGTHPILELWPYAD